MRVTLLIFYDHATAAAGSGIIPRMDLPILRVSASASLETLVRYFHQCESKWTSHFAESEQLEFGTAYCNPQLDRVYMSNRIMDAALPEGMSAALAVEQADAHFAERGSVCWQWIMNPSAPGEQTAPLVEHLQTLGWKRWVSDIMYLDRMPAASIEIPRHELTIIPARASFRHARQIEEEASRKWNEPQLIDAGLMHLDDPHYDSLLALKDGSAAAMVGVLSVGEIGMIEPVFVTEALRGQGIGTIMMSRALEICARSLFKHIFICVDSANANAIELYAKFGFRKIAEFLDYLRVTPGQ